MNVKQEILNAFYNTKSGLTRNIANLKKKNPKLQLISNDSIRAVLNQSIESYNRNKRNKKIKDYVKYNASYVGEILHADLMFLNSPRNKRQRITIKDDSVNKYLLVIVDTYSRFIWAYPINSKQSTEIAKLIHEVIEFIEDFFYSGNDLIHYKVLTDAGKEFSTHLIENERIKHIISKNKRGAALAEGAIYKIRTKLKYFKPNLRVLDNAKLQDIIYNANSESEANEILFGDKIKELEEVKEEEAKVFNQGDYVRIARELDIFDKKSAIDNFDEKIFVVIDDVFDLESGIYRYKIASIDGQYISDNKYYKEELNQVTINYITSLKQEEIDKSKKFSKEEIKKYNLILNNI